MQEIEEKAKSAFIERLNKRRAKEEPIEKVEKKVYKNNVFSFESYKNDGLEIEEKAKSAFIERLNKRRAKEEPIEKVEKKVYKNNVFSFESYKNDGLIRRK